MFYEMISSVPPLTKNSIQGDWLVKNIEHCISKRKEYSNLVQNTLV